MDLIVKTGSTKQEIEEKIFSNSKEVRWLYLFLHSKSI